MFQSYSPPWQRAAVLLLFVSQLFQVAGAEPAVTPPPAEFFSKVREKYRDSAREFYQKHLEANGLSIVASREVADEALQRTRTIVQHLLAGRPDVFSAMVSNGMYLIIIGKDQVYTDMPEYSDHPNPAFQNERVRGTGGKPTSFGEENLLSLPIDRYDDESIAVHEFCHTIDATLRSIDSTWNERRNQTYRRAIEAGRWKNSYAAGNPAEFWAEIAQSYFDCNRVNNWNHGPIGTREQLKAYDPESYELVRSTFRLSPAQDWRYTFARPLPNVTNPPPQFKIDPYYTKFTYAREFPVIGHGASDASLLAANDIIRKMFAYRHDLLKALINHPLKLVVLGPGERLADLPEVNSLLAKRKNEVKSNDPSEGMIDLLGRYFSYTPEAGILVVAQENVLSAPGQPYVGGSQVIRVLADAIYKLTAQRPVDPNWENRGRAVQQYELRVQRLDTRFGEKLRELHTRATSAQRWQGTPASAGPAQYWIAGVLAYFDAEGQTPAPIHALQPIVTRAALKSYDTPLHDFVHEIFGYEGKPAWSLRR